jgi:cell division protein FtsI (penicillin-binding protein 3)
MKLINYRLFIAFVFILIMPAVIVARLLHIQVLNHQKFERLAAGLVSEKKVKNSERGLIYDRNMQVLAMNINSFSIAANPRQITDPAGFARSVSALTGIPEEHIKEKVRARKNSYFVWIKRQMLIDDAGRLKDAGIDGLIIVPEQRRYYPYGALAAQVVGVTDVDSKGLSAMERVHDKFGDLTRTVEDYKKFGNGRKIKVSPDGAGRRVNVVSTIDARLQYIAAKEVEEVARKYGAKSAFAVLQDPSNGEILAMASWPSFNPNEYSFTRDDLIMPAFQQVFEPGSTFKLITAGAALAEGLYNRNNVVFCENGTYKYMDIEINDHEKYGYLTFDGMFAYSSNIGFAKVGMALGKYKLYHWIRQFGFGNYTGLNLAGEQRGILFPPDSRKWTMVTCPTVSYGHGIGVTALQIVNAYSAAANGGTLYETRIVKSIIDDDKREIIAFPLRKIREVLPPNVAGLLKEMLSNVVEYGTGRLAAVNGYRVCGKTGTAQKVDPSTGEYGSRYVASFCGFLPMENPKITVLVVIDEPKTNYWASDVACPVFSRIAAQAMNYINIPATGEKYEFTKLSR